MPSAVTMSLNRVISLQSVIADIAATTIYVDLKIDPSQQLRISSIAGMYGFQNNADKNNVFIGSVIGFLDRKFDPANFAISPIGPELTVPSDLAAEIFYYDYISPPHFITSYRNLVPPIIINGDRRVTFGLTPPALTGGAFTANLIFRLAVYGEITQMSDQDKPRYGEFALR